MTPRTSRSWCTGPREILKLNSVDNGDVAGLATTASASLHSSSYVSNRPKDTAVIELQVLAIRFTRKLHQTSLGGLCGITLTRRATGTVTAEPRNNAEHCADSARRWENRDIAIQQSSPSSPCCWSWAVCFV